ncbi:MAG: alpha/beta hydrolase, partial [Nocardioidaceae bacterium]
LGAVALIAWCTWWAAVPLRRPWALGRMSWRFGFLVNELPFIAGYWLLASTLLAFGEGDIASPGAGAVVGLAVLTTAGLALLVVRALRARPALDSALDEGLGAGWRTALDPALAARLRRRRPWVTILFVPFAIRRRDVRHLRNLAYADGGDRHLLDVYHSRARPAGAPILVYLHGGGFVGGRKDREARPLLYRLAGQGWVCLSANYRLSPAVQRVDQIADLKRVIGWARANAAEYGADPASLFVAGSSAGANLAVAAALTANDPALQPGFELSDTSVAAAIGLYGYYGGLDPSSLPQGDAPPVFVVHGDKDSYVAVEGVRGFVSELRRTSARPVVYAELPGGQHTFDLVHSVRFEAVIDAVDSFTAWVRSP